MRSSRTFPDTFHCRTRHVYGEVYRCLADDACRCPHGLAFAYSYYCKHPDCRNFDAYVGCDILTGMAAMPGETVLIAQRVGN
jgi:hypothetical protein